MGGGIWKRRVSRQPVRVANTPSCTMLTGRPTEPSSERALPGFEVKRVAGARKPVTRTGAAMPLRRTSAALTAEMELHAVSTRTPRAAMCASRA